MAIDGCDFLSVMLFLLLSNGLLYFPVSIYVSVR